MRLPRGASLGVLFFGVLAVSTGSIFARLADAPPLTTAMWRTAIGTLAFLPFARKLAPEWRALHWKHRLSAIGAGLMLAAHLVSWFISLNLTTVGASVLLVNTAPVWVALACWLMRLEKLSARTAAGIAVSFGGSVVVAGGSAGSSISGALWAIAGALLMAGYLMLGRRVRKRLSLTSYVLLSYGSAAVALALAVAVCRQPVLSLPAQSIGWLVALGLVSQVMGHSSYNWALGHHPATLVSVSLLGEPVLASLAAWRIFGETPTFSLAIGGVVVLAGVALVATAPEATG